MQVEPIQTNYNNWQAQYINTNTVQKPCYPQLNGISNVFYLPISFGGATFETRIIKPAMTDMFPKLGGIFTKDGSAIDMNKITWDNLLSEKLDITKASKRKRLAYRYFLSILESYGKNPKDNGDFATQWNEKFNPFNMKSPLAVVHYLADMAMKELTFAPLRAMLKNPKKCTNLDVPVFDNKGNLRLNATFFDTETTGTHTDKDKIVQLGAVVMKDGKISKVCNQLVNPEMHIPEGASAVNGITDSMVFNAPKMKDIAKDFLPNVLNAGDGIIATWNGVKFDIPLLNRLTREIRGQEGITIGTKWDKSINETPLINVLDFQIIHLRLHPCLGSSKQLGKQYHWLFCKPMEDAHNALSDVKGTMAIAEYDLRLLDSLRLDKSKPLTLRQVMQFQNGEPEVPNLDIKLDPNRGFNTNAKYYPSYKREPLDYEHYFSNYNLCEELINKLEPQIGSENVRKFYEYGIIDSIVGDTYKGNQLQAAETKKIPGTAKKKNLAYEMRKNLEILFETAGIDGYKNKNKESVRELIAQKSMQFISTNDSGMEAEKLSRGRWIKNVNPDDIKDGNDLPNDEIAIKVMQEAKKQKFVA